jgi:hypothetical protein
MRASFRVPTHSGRWRDILAKQVGRLIGRAATVPGRPRHGVPGLAPPLDAAATVP